MCWYGNRARWIAVALAVAASSRLSAATSTLQNPTVVFTTAGLKMVSLTACRNLVVCSTVQQTVTVLDPLPKILSAAAASSSAEIGQLVRLDATGTGRPSLNYSWTILKNGIQVASANGATAYWNTAAMTTGVHDVALRLSNIDGFMDSADSLPPLPPIQVTLVANTATDFYTIEPCRLLDTRILGGALASGESRLLPSSFTTCGVPREARALAANITAVAATAIGSVKIYPGNYPQPSESVIHFGAGLVRANNQVLPVSTDGVATLRAVAELPAGASVHLVVDVSGYFAPPPTP